MTPTIALYAAKHDGGKPFRVFRSQMSRLFFERLDVQLDLDRALLESQLCLVYQPIVDLRHNKPVGVEALLRWRHPHRGLLSPESFLAAAEESGTIVPIGCVAS